MTAPRLIALISLIAVAFSGCSRDPQAIAQAYIDSGDRYLKERKFQEATIEYQNALKRHPRSSLALQRLGDLYLETGDKLQSWQAYQRAAQLAPDDIPLQIKAGAVLLITQRFDDARRIAEAVLEKDPKNARAFVLRANALAGLEDLDTAITQIRQALELDPSQSELYSNLGSLEATSGQLDDAEATYKKAIEVAPTSAPAHAALGNFYWATGKAQLAEQAFTKAIEVEPQSIIAHRAAATFYLGSGRPLPAERSLRFVADHSGEYEARLALGDYYLLTGRRDQGVAEIETARKLPVAYAEATTRLVALAYAEGRRQEAEKDLEALLAKHPRSPHALLLKARFLLRRGEGGEALRLATAATDIDDTYIQAYYLAAELHAADGDYFQAAEAYRAVLKVNPFAAPAPDRVVASASGRGGR